MNLLELSSLYSCLLYMLWPGALIAWSLGGPTRKILYQSSWHVGRRYFVGVSMSVSERQHTQDQQRPLVVVIAGPTASGKSDVAAHVCALKNGIIVSADSVQAYQHVQIGANKPDAAELARTPHVLVDVADNSQNYNVDAWRRDAIFSIQHMAHRPTESDSVYSCEVEDAEDRKRQASLLETIQHAKAEKRASSTSSNTNDNSANPFFLPVVVGGSMMYIQWLVHGRPDALRPTERAVAMAKVEMARFESDQDWPSAQDWVRSQGATFAQQVETLSGPDWYRLRRILEVAYTVQEQGESVASDNAAAAVDIYNGERVGGLTQLGFDVRCFFLCPDDRMKHTKVVDLRCEDMICRGLLQETTDLVLSGKMPDMVSRAIGYRQSIEYLQREGIREGDEDGFADFVAQFTAATRQYSKKQMQWFRRDQEFMFVSVPLDQDNKEQRVQSVAGEILRMMALPREEFDAERRCSASASAKARATNAAQAKGMKIYQLKKERLVSGLKELTDALNEADSCTQRFQAKKPRLESIVT